MVCLSMFFPFHPKVKSPADLVKKCKETVEKLEGSNKKAQEELSKALLALKQVLFGSAEGEPQAEVLAQLSQEMYKSHLLFNFCESLAKMDFEARKDVVQIFGKILKREVGQRFPTVEYICTQKPEILTELCRGYENAEIALNTGIMLRECIAKEPLAKIILYSDELFYKFFDYVQLSQFDIASDAFATFKDLLSSHKILCADFLEKNYDRIFDKYVELLNSENYVTRRQSLKLLGELLLDRANFTVMTKYISNPENLKLMMNMLRDKSRNIQFEAFHVFKVFVANPNKTKPILDILLKNKSKLVTFLDAFHNDRAEDDQFSDEKKYLIKQIKDLQ